MLSLDEPPAGPKSHQNLYDVAEPDIRGKHCSTLTISKSSSGIEIRCNIMIWINVTNIPMVEWRGQDAQSEAERPDHAASLGDSVVASHSDDVFGRGCRRPECA